MRMRAASVILLTVMMVASTMFVATANALVPGTNVPAGVPAGAGTGFSGQGQFRQGVQTGTPIQGQVQSGGVAANVPGRLNQQQGAGIYVGSTQEQAALFLRTPRAPSEECRAGRADRGPAIA